MLDHHGFRKASIAGGGCSCEDTVAVLAYLGAHKSAEMHRHPDVEYSPEDWFEHMHEEEVYLCPLLEQRGYGRAARRITDEHVKFRTYYRRHGKLPLEELHEHGKYEDKVIREALPDLVAQVNPR